MNTAEMTQRMKDGRGFIAALDQSGGSTPKALAAYGVAAGAWSTEAEMFGLIHAMRVRIITAPAFTGDKVLGAILFERTMDGALDDGTPVPRALHDRGVVPFLKIDKGLEDEADGVQRMKPIPGLDALLARARGLGVFGTKERSVVALANRAGIAAVVAQQFDVARQVLAAGLVPIIEPEVSIRSAERAGADAILIEELTAALDAHDGAPVMLKLSLPAMPGAYAPLIAHPKVLRVVALSGGYDRADACAELARNPGVIASFSRALLEDLHADMDDAAFDRALRSAIDEIYAASTEKAPA